MYITVQPPPQRPQVDNLACARIPIFYLLFKWDITPREGPSSLAFLKSLVNFEKALAMPSATPFSSHHDSGFVFAMPRESRRSIQRQIALL
jgi:hypothetical protein